jgi:tetratricopeptide (TPR) repeat protein
LTREDLAYTHKKTADCLVGLNDYSQARSHFNKAHDNYEKVVAGAPADLVSQFLVITCRAGAAGMRARLGDVALALEECRKTKALLQQISGDEINLGRVQACEYLGQAYVALAASPNVPWSDSKEHTTAARDMFRQALNILDALRRQGTLGPNESWAKEIAAELAQCDAALAK